jgi:hypothetical protein
MFTGNYHTSSKGYYFYGLKKVTQPVNRLIRIRIDKTLGNRDNLARERVNELGNIGLVWKMEIEFSFPYEGLSCNFLIEAMK